MANQLLNHLPISEMVNGHPEDSFVTLGVNSEEEMMEHIKQLILENDSLKETMKRMNQVMKAQLEDLYEQFKSKFVEANRCLLDMRNENEQLRNQIQNVKQSMEESTQAISIGSASEEVTENLKQLKVQLLRLQAEKADLLGIISELQLKLSTCSSEDSFIEIRFAQKDTSGEVKEKKEFSGNTNHEFIACRKKPSCDDNHLESEEVTVRRLLHSLREETQKVETLEKALKSASASERLKQVEMIDTDLQTETDVDQTKSDIYLSEQETQTEIVMEERKRDPDLSEQETQTDVDMDINKGERQTAECFSTEVDALKVKVENLNKELHDTNERLNEAEQIKKRLQDNCILLDKRLSENQVNLIERQELLHSIKTLELQVESMKSELKIEQNKTEAEKKQYYPLLEAFEKQKYEYEELKKRESETVPKVMFNELLRKLDTCEKALAKKQLQIDELTEKVTKQEEDIETMGVLRAQIDVYCSDFHAEREARVNIHQEKEQIATQLAMMLEENEKLSNELLEKQSIEDFQRRHRSTSSGEGSETPRLVERGAENAAQQNPVFTCPKCSMVAPDIDTLQIHIMDCVT
ncbi:optineurin isoform X2 [Bombina bombina]|uniref:optineurin isoform X2 n=1 Tax=Bombina bombina TaxID=8345 RepID=UPI00235AACC9|nr:optineurin isoform X2 [Bombina bombina]